MPKKTTILLTGSTGYLGSNILKKLVAEGYEVILLKRSHSNIFRIAGILGRLAVYDLDQTPLEKIFLEHHIDIILHCATDYGRKRVEPLQVIDANLTLPLHLLELGKAHSIDCFINTDTILDKRVSHYSLSKRQFNDWFQMYRGDLCCLNIALEHFYGPGDDSTKFVSFLINKLKANAEKIDLTPGEQMRDFVYIADVVAAFMQVVQNYRKFGRGYFSFEIGSGELISIKDLAIKIKALTGNTVTDLKFGAIPYRENEVMNHRVDLSAIRALGWSSKESLTEGLQKTIQEHNDV